VVSSWSTYNPLKCLKQTAPSSVYFFASCPVTLTDLCIFCWQHVLSKTLEQPKKEIQVSAEETVAFFVALAEFGSIML
jgi:hypothetical protein